MQYFNFIISTKIYFNFVVSDLNYSMFQANDDADATLTSVSASTVPVQSNGTIATASNSVSQIEHLVQENLVRSGDDSLLTHFNGDGGGSRCGGGGDCPIEEIYVNCKHNCKIPINNHVSCSREKTACHENATTEMQSMCCTEDFSSSEREESDRRQLSFWYFLVPPLGAVALCALLCGSVCWGAARIRRGALGVMDAMCSALPWRFLN